MLLAHCRSFLFCGAPVAPVPLLDPIPAGWDTPRMPDAEPTASEGAGLHALVYGRVQDVYFRRFVYEHARALGVTGFVRNLADGRSLEVLAEGPRAALEDLLRLVGAGPPAARVDRVEAVWTGDAPGFSQFEIR